MEREDVVVLCDRASVVGIGYILLVSWLHGATVGELALLTREDRHTVGGRLRDLELRGFVMRVQSGHADKWFPSLMAQILLCEVQLAGFPPVGPTTTTALLDPPRSKAAEEEAGATGVIPANKTVRLNPARVAALRAAGIGLNLHAELCGYKWCTPAYIKAHDEYRRARGESTGMLITRLRCHDPAPEKKRSVAEDWERLASRRK